MSAFLKNLPVKRLGGRCLSVYLSVPDTYAQHVLKGLCSVHALVPDAYAQCTHQFLTHMRGIRISSWRICSAHASVSDVYAQRTHQFLTRMLRVYKMNIWKMEKLMCMLSMLVRNWCLIVRLRISSWHARSVQTSVSDRDAERADKGQSMRVRSKKFEIKVAKNFCFCLNRY